MLDLTRLINGMRRGTPWQALAVYLVGAWIAYQVIQSLTEGLDLPGWFPALALVLLIVGLPIVLATAVLQARVSAGRRYDPTLLPEASRTPAAGAPPMARAPAARHFLTWRRAIGGGVLAFAAWGAIAAGWLLLRGTDRDAGASRVALGTASSRIAVLPFSLRGGEEFAYLGEGMVDLLSTSLDGAGLTSVDPRAVLGFVARQGGGAPDPERGLEIARRLGAGFYVLGNVVEVGGQLQLSASLYATERGPEAVAEASKGGKATEVFRLVDDLAAELLLGRRAPAARIAAVTTDSLPALKEYLLGEQAMRAGRFTTAAEAFQRAVAIDSAFALAWYRLSVAWEWLTRHDLVREAAEKAFRHSGRLSEHDRQLFEAAVATRNGDPARAEELYRAILANYPDDVEAWSQLGEVLHHYGPLEGRPMSAAREAFERVLFYEPDEVTALVHLVRTAAREGNRTQLDSLVRRAIELTPEGDRAVEMRTLRALTIGDTAERRIVLADLEHATDPPLFVTAWDLPIASGNLDAGRTVASILTQPARSPEVRALGHMNLAYLYATQGRWRQARVELAAAESLDSTRALELGAYLMAVPLLPVSPTDLQNERAAIRHLDPAAVAASMHPSAWVAVHNGLHEHLKLYLVGLLSARLGDAAAAESCAAALERLPSPHGADSFSLDLALGLRAQVARAAGRPEEALQLLERAPRRRWYQLTLTSPFFSQAAERYLRAALLEETGRQEEALRWYSSFEEVSQFDLAFLPASHLQRAAIYEQRGDLERAAHYLRRFIELWSAADPELLPLVRRAEQRLAALGEASQTP